ncbi:MAG: hypothetical protein IJ519_00450, partial [Clostridia bacterium]|nr:hypothetical protein [Clostridia bacterium]
MGISVMYLFGRAYSGLLPSELAAGIAAFAVAGLISDTLLSFLTGGVTFVVVCTSLLMLFGLNDGEKAKVKAVLN